MTSTPDEVFVQADWLIRSVDVILREEGRAETTKVLEDNIRAGNLFLTMDDYDQPNGWWMYSNRPLRARGFWKGSDGDTPKALPSITCRALNRVLKGYDWVTLFRIVPFRVPPEVMDGFKL